MRVSAADQNEDRQMDAMYALHLSKKYIYVDKRSGKDFDRPKYLKLQRKLKAGDGQHIGNLFIG